MVITDKFPLPEVVKPVMLGELGVPVHAKVVLLGVGAGSQVTNVVASPEQIVCVKELLVIVGVGLMVTEKPASVPGQLLKVGSTEIVPTIVPGVLLLVLVGADQDPILPVPLASKPIDVLEFTQEKEAPIGMETKVLGLIVSPGQTAIGLNGPTVTTGLTYAITGMGFPGQAEAVGVMV